MTKLVIFDLDGTLLNTIADLGAACNQALSHFHYPTHELADYPRLVGNGVNNLIRRALPEGERTEENVQRLRTVFVPYYDEHNCVFTKPYEGIVEVLNTLRERGIRLAVASNKYQAATQQIVAHFFPNTFDCVLGEREGIARKPDPQIVTDIMAEIGISDKSEVLYIGDSDVDMQTAKNAHLRAVGCLWGFCTEETLRAENPAILINKPEEILRIIDN